jgi:hypothetical protein
VRIQQNLSRINQSAASFLTSVLIPYVCPAHVNTARVFSPHNETANNNVKVSEELFQSIV